MARSELVDALRSSGAQALAAMTAVPDAALDAPGYENGWTVRGIMAHVASMEFAYRRLPDIARSPGGDAQTTGSGGRFDMDAYNARQVEKRAVASREQLTDEFVRGRGALIVTAAALDDDLLAVPVRSAGGVTGTLAEVLRATATNHIRAHAADFAHAAGDVEPSRAELAAAAILLAAAEARAVLAGAPETAWRRTDGADGWSAANIAGHMAEAMPYWAVTARNLSTQPGAAVGRALDAPERLGAVALGDRLSPGEATDEIERAAAEAATAIRSISPEGWNTMLQHRTSGSMTAGELVERLVVAHAREHLGQMGTALRG